MFGDFFAHVFLEVLDKSLCLGVNGLGEIDTGVLVSLFQCDLFIGRFADTDASRDVLLDVVFLLHLHFNEEACRLFLRGLRRIA